MAESLPYAREGEVGRSRLHPRLHTDPGRRLVAASVKVFRKRPGGGSHRAFAMVAGMEGRRPLQVPRAATPRGPSGRRRAAARSTDSRGRPRQVARTWGGPAASCRSRRAVSSAAAAAPRPRLGPPRRGPPGPPPAGDDQVARAGGNGTGRGRRPFRAGGRAKAWGRRLPASRRAAGRRGSPVPPPLVRPTGPGRWRTGAPTG